jgi:hypothetical protein
MIINNLTFPDVASDILSDLDSQPTQFNLMGINVALNSNSYICINCSALLWSEVLYKYREKISDRIPNSVSRRPKCWYGKECRT